MYSSCMPERGAGGGSTLFLLICFVEGIRFLSKHTWCYLTYAYCTSVLLAIIPSTKLRHVLTFLSTSREYQHEIEWPRPNIATPNLQYLLENTYAQGTLLSNVSLLECCNC